jgi:hypothetical protein
MALRAQAPLSLNEGSWISMAAAITAYYLIHAWFKPECTTTSVYSEERKKKVGNIWAGIKAYSLPPFIGAGCSCSQLRFGWPQTSRIVGPLVPAPRDRGAVGGRGLRTEIGIDSGCFALSCWHRRADGGDLGCGGGAGQRVVTGPVSGAHRLCFAGTALSIGVFLGLH